MDPDQLASEKPADLDLRCFLSRIYQGINFNYQVYALQDACQTAKTMISLLHIKAMNYVV